jgi:hypothetical protein
MATGQTPTRVHSPAAAADESIKIGDFFLILWIKKNYFNL